MIKDCILIEALTCQESEKVTEVAKQLREHLIRYLYVINDVQEPVGVISVVDINNRVVAEGKDPNTLTAKEIMTTPIKSYEETEEERVVYEDCVRNNLATCPITKGKKIVGAVTIHELLKGITRVGDNSQ